VAHLRAIGAGSGGGGGTSLLCFPYFVEETGLPCFLGLVEETGILCFLDLAAGRDRPVVLFCAGHQGGGLRGGAGVAAGVDSVVVLLCTGLRGGVFELLLCVLVSLRELLLPVLGGLLGHIAGEIHVQLGDLRLDGSLVNVGHGAGLGGLDVKPGGLRPCCLWGPSRWSPPSPAHWG
jgi:hypothetical protein